MCVISTTKNFIFIHIPKTAGQSITSLLQPYRTHGQNLYIHTLGRELKALFPDIYDKTFRFAFVRNPWERLYSLYEFTRLRFFQYPSRYVSYPSFVNKDFDKPFSEWLLNTEFVIPDEANLCETPLPAQRKSQFEWLTDDAGDLIVDYIGRLENLQYDLDKICDAIGIARKRVPHINANPRRKRNYRKFYTQEAREHVGHFFEKEIRAFDYEF